MTNDTISIFHRLTQFFIVWIIYGQFLQLHRVGMACAADFDHRPLRQAGFSGSMWIMTGPTSALLEKGTMNPFFPHGIVDHIIVALVAKDRIPALADKNPRI
jgi:hypothetical protein